jgi:predicted  nucleic acid-binding Zn-ribbon protein
MMNCELEQKGYCKDCTASELYFERQEFVGARGERIKVLEKIHCKHEWACKRMHEIPMQNNDHVIRCPKCGRIHKLIESGTITCDCGVIWKTGAKEETI